jgi:hypothetical protein
MALKNGVHLGFMIVCERLQFGHGCSLSSSLKNGTGQYLNKCSGAMPQPLLWEGNRGHIGKLGNSNDALLLILVAYDV